MERLTAAARLALSLDQDPNSDLINFIAGYGSSSGLFRYVGTKEELLTKITGRERIRVEPIATGPHEIDLAVVMPSEFRGHPVYFEALPEERIHVWQKVPGGIRKVTIARRISKLLFLSGVVLYAAEGSKYSPGSTDVQFSNATPGTHRLFLEFLEALGISRRVVKARTQIHDLSEREQAQRYWERELGLNPPQFHKPLMAPKGEGTPRRQTFTLSLKYNNAMLVALLTAWGADSQKTYTRLAGD